MARINVYLPDELARQVKTAELNVSAVVQEALRRALDAERTDAWLDDVSKVQTLAISRKAIVEAVTAAREELGA